MSSSLVKWLAYSAKGLRFGIRHGWMFFHFLYYCSIYVRLIKIVTTEKLPMAPSAMGPYEKAVNAHNFLIVCFLCQPYK